MNKYDVRQWWAKEYLEETHPIQQTKSEISKYCLGKKEGTNKNLTNQNSKQNCKHMILNDRFKYKGTHFVIGGI